MENMSKFYLLTITICVVFFCTGCGETIHGMVKDAKRIGAGVKQVFVRE